MDNNHIDDQFVNNVFHILWDDLSTLPNYPDVRPLLAHYTSINAFEKILEHEELWFSNPLHMNDWQELRFGMNEGASEFRLNETLKLACNSPDKYSFVLNHFDDLYRTFNNEQAFDTYVFCLSEHNKSDYDGSLSMWRGYGAGGGRISIVFDTENLSFNEKAPFIFSKVQYMTTKERFDWLRNKVTAISEIISSQNISGEHLKFIIQQWFERLKIFSLFTKHSGFHEEKEWRFVYLKDRDEKNVFTDRLDYAITAKGIEPKLKYRVQPIDGLTSKNFTLENVIDRVILGPTISTPLAERSLKRLVESKQKPKIADKVFGSTIPFRN